MEEKNSAIEKNNQIIEARAEQLAKRIEALVVEARKNIASTVNVAMVYTYFEVGRYIIEDEQGGKLRAEYGKGILKGVSARLTASLGKGWSVDTLEKTRRFFLTFSKSATPQRFWQKARIPLQCSGNSFYRGIIIRYFHMLIIPKLVASMK